MHTSYLSFFLHKSPSQSQSESSSVVVVEKDSPAASVAVQAAREYLDKNQGAKVGKEIALIFLREKKN